MFDVEHFIWIFITVFCVIALSVISKKKNFSLKTAGYIMSTISLISEISKIMSDMTEGGKGGYVLAPTSLPFHLCSLMLFGVLFITFGKDGKAKQIVIDFIAVAGILGSICAILIPTVGTDFLNIQSYQCFVYHGGLLWFGIYLILSGKSKPCLKTLGRNMIILLLLIWALIYVNSVLSVYNVNFMYLVRPPMENLPFLNLNQGWYIYFLRLVGLGVSIISLFHLPFIIAQRKKK
ncbi:MAG: TIGR02206 family membrane protein [Clostridia bacterium]|nr:TIGR02206 family membrane protein [Clostridia bacterium]